MTVRTLLIAVVVMLMHPAAAAAADARVEGGRIVLDAAAGEANDVRVGPVVAEDVEWHVTLRDGGAPLAAGEGCEAGAEGSILCRVAASGDIIVLARLGDGADSFTAAGTCAGTPLCVQVDSGAGDDTVIGSAGADWLGGGTGNDSLDGRGGVGYGFAPTGDELHGGRGDDRLNGGRDADLLVGGPGADVLEGGRGLDVVSYANRRTSVRVQLDGDPDDGARGERDRIGFDVEQIEGGRGDDRLVGDGRANTLDGGSGDDVVLGLSGPDFLIGGLGADVVRGGGGRDRLDATWVDPQGHAVTTERRGRDLLFGGAGDDFLDGADNTADRLSGGSGRDDAHVDSGLDRVLAVERVVGTRLAGRLPARAA